MRLLGHAALRSCSGCSADLHPISVRRVQRAEKRQAELAREQSGELQGEPVPKGKKKRKSAPVEPAEARDSPVG
jgi:hypothetical protein